LKSKWDLTNLPRECPKSLFPSKVFFYIFLQIRSEPGWPDWAIILVLGDYLLWAVL
jgi:hypothetical protein